jgi:uncharacterized membrane protein YhaH (DUF805 family)
LTNYHKERPDAIISLAIQYPAILFTDYPNLQKCRQHDTDHSSWWLWLIFIPLLGVLILLVMCFNSKDDNKYGSKPKAEPSLGDKDNLVV